MSSGRSIVVFILGSYVGARVFRPTMVVATTLVASRRLGGSMVVHDEGQFQRDIVAEMVASGGWRERPASVVDKVTRVLIDDLVGYLEDTQPAAVERFAAVAGASWRQQLAEIVANDLDKEPGRVLGLLRGGKKVKGGVRFSFCQFKPANDLNADLVAAYEANRLT